VEARSLVELFQDEPVDFLVSGSGAYYIALRQSKLYVNKSNKKFIEHRAIFQRERQNSISKQTDKISQQPENWENRKIVEEDGTILTNNEKSGIINLPLQS
jgi:hypothetical protein